MIQLKESQIFKPSQIDELLKKEFKFVKNNKKLEYLNIPIAFDIETTSFYDANKQKASTMYAWVLGIYDSCIIGRTWDEWLLILDKIVKFYELNDNRRIIIWIHNFAFEWSFIQYMFNWKDIFASDERKPIYAITDKGIEFRCSYILSGYSLEMVAKNLVKHHLEKKKGDLDYSLMRHSLTPLTNLEYSYILYDGLIVLAYVDELLDEYDNFHRLPLTKTGFTRKYVRNECLYGGNKSHKKSGTYQYYKKYHNLMMSLTIPSLQCYQQLKRIFMGGFTHANALYSGITIKDDIYSFDLSSSYPSSIVQFKYPMSTPRLIKLKDMDEFKECLNTYCCMFDITFYGVKPKQFQDHPLSYSKCVNVINAKVDNGRIVECDELTTSLNEIDFDIINDYYEYNSIEVWNMRIMDKGYLPTPFIKAILKLYQDKTALKGSTNQDDLVRYMSAKGNINGCFGMCVTDIMQDSIKFKDNHWIKEDVDIKEVFTKYNHSKNRFLYYPWGVW